MQLREWVSAQVKIEEKKSAEALEREERRLLREEQKNEMTLRAQEKLKQEESFRKC